MSKLISGKEALKLVADGVVQYIHSSETQERWTTITDHFWCQCNLGMFLDTNTAFRFRLKPRTITINGIEVPAPCNGELSHKQYAYVLNTASPDGYGHIKFYEGNAKPLACWICEDEIKQVVSALRSVFKPQ